MVGTLWYHQVQLKRSCRARDRINNQRHLLSGKLSRWAQQQTKPLVSLFQGSKRRVGNTLCCCELLQRGGVAMGDEFVLCRVNGSDVYLGSEVFSATALQELKVRYAL